MGKQPLARGRRKFRRLTSHVAAECLQKVFRELEHIVGEGHFADPAESEDESASPEVPGAPTPAPRATVAAAESELEEVTERLKAELKSRHPKLFDARGRLRTRQYARELSKRTGGRQTLTRTEIVALGKHRTEPTDEASALDAP